MERLAVPCLEVAFVKDCSFLHFVMSLQDTHSGNLTRSNPIPDNRVFISVPGDYSRKPPIGGNL